MEIPDEVSRNRAYQRGWNEAQDWRHPHINPYPERTDEWFDWWNGFNEGKPPVRH